MKHMKYMLGLGLLFVALVPLTTIGSNKLVKFKGGIGCDPISNVVVSGGTTTATANTVMGASPAGQIWRIADLDADVSIGGHIRVRGRGLLLAGGNGIGTNAGASVFATQFCGGVPSSTSAVGVALESNGDFTIDDVLSPTPSNPCGTPVLLIRSAANDHWFAAGIIED